MIQPPRIGAHRLSQCQPKAGAQAGRNPVWVASPSGPRNGSGPIFDPEHAAFRATLLSLAREGHRLLERIAEDHLEADSLAVLSLLQRIDQFEEQVAHRRLESVRRWVQQLKGLVHTTAAVPR
jgi:hypothetical protein